MLVVINNEEKFFYTQGMVVKPLEITGDVLVIIDPSKTNMAVMVSSPWGEIYKCLEFSGNNRGAGPTMDTTLYCEEVRSYLKAFLSKCSIFIAGVEAAITKKGMTHHHSNMVLTEIRGSLLNFFLEEYGIRAIEINNWAWKHAVLPEGFRSQKEKGSKRYIQTYYPNSPLANYFQADMTDAFCMTMYVVSSKCSNYVLVCNQHEDVSVNTRKFWIYPWSISRTLKAQPVKINTHFTLQENATFISNRTKSMCYGIVDINDLRIEDLYGHCMGFADVPTDGAVTVIIEGSQIHS